MKLDAFSAIRARFASDPARPRYHYLPPSNWMNDPNGVIQWGDQYHLFYQYNPTGAYHMNMHWGHAVSSDLVHWRDLPIALAPTPGSSDEGGIYSGCAVNNNGTPTIFYTGVDHGAHRQMQCLATGSDDLVQWTKSPDNPIISDVPAESGQTRDFRDPFVWRGGDAWYMVVGSQVAGVGGTAFLYQSEDLTTWEYLNPLCVGDHSRNGVVWECPNFFELDGKWVLIISAHTGSDTGKVFYFVGTYENHRFYPEHEDVLDHGYLYAPLTLKDTAGRRLMWGWLREGRTVEAHVAAGWAGVQSIPRVLALDEHNRLLMRPVPEVEAIRDKHHSLTTMLLNGYVDVEARGQTLDIKADVALDERGTFTLSVLCSDDDSQRTDIHYSAAEAALVIEREHASTADTDERHPHRATHSLANGEHLSLRVLLDGSVLEVIANERTSITSRVYPTSFSQDELRVHGQNATLHTLEIYEMPSIWE